MNQYNLGESDRGMSCRWEDGQEHTGEGKAVNAGWRREVSEQSGDIWWTRGEQTQNNTRKKKDHENDCL